MRFEIFVFRKNVGRKKNVEQKHRIHAEYFIYLTEEQKKHLKKLILQYTKTVKNTKGISVRKKSPYGKFGKVGPPPKDLPYLFSEIFDFGPQNIEKLIFRIFNQN